MDILSLNFLADENFPLPSVKLLRQNGLNVRSIVEESPAITDNNVLSLAVQEDLVILTFDKDFGELIFKKRTPPPRGIFLFRLHFFYPEDPAIILLDLINDKTLKINELTDRKFFGVINQDSFRLENLIE